MKRLLFVLCSLVAVQEVCARRPAVRFDLPYTVEHGKYVVVLGTPAGPRRFIFDTGASGTCISESLRDELGAEAVKTEKVRDFEGHVVPIDLVRLDSLRMGDALFRDHPVLVMPDTSLVFACLRVDGIAGCDLLRWCAVRMPNADSTITVTDDVRRLGLPRGRRMSRMELGGGCPFLPVTCRNGDRQARMYVTETRIAAAKEMLEQGDLKVYEIAEKLGYESAFYFSKVFKKVTGLSPREYQQSI